VTHSHSAVSKSESGSPLSSMSYLAVMLGALLLHWCLLDLELGLAWSVYLPVLLAVVCIALLEWRYPFQRYWLPNRKDVPTDLSFLVLMQFLLPELILATAFLLALDSKVLSQPQALAVWPHHWPLLLQTVVIMLMVDFAIYWMHRALHQWPWLWRFHAVHHSPQKLYWLNVGRDHPLETAMLFVFGILPFYFLGIDAKVLALYFVLFDIHAFFQHSNINIRYGLLNYVMSTSELHRWHHAREPQVSNHNFGNTFIFWDLLFGTWWFPHRNATDVGVRNHHYPLGFWDLMRAPFTVGLTDREQPFRSTGKICRDVITRLKSTMTHSVRKP